MELRAAVEGLSLFGESHYIHLISDSAYMINSLKFGWWKEWKRLAWTNPKTHQRTPNADLWIKLIELCDFHEVEPIKVKGHDGNRLNERCDKLAKLARKRGADGSFVHPSFTGPRFHVGEE
jgi:ribonuclease HI